MKGAYELPVQRSKNRKMKDKGRRDRDAYLWALYQGTLIRNLSERERTDKKRLYWEDEVGVISETKGKQDLVYLVRFETKINGKMKILHRHLLLTRKWAPLEEPKGLHLIRKNKNSTTSSKKEQESKDERDSQDSHSEYCESDGEEEYTPRKLGAVEQTELEKSSP